MRILNIMLGKGRGGLEQVALDYHHALTKQGHQVINVFSPTSWAASQAETLGQSTSLLRNRGEWDFLAALKIRALVKDTRCDAIICHGNRAIRLTLKFRKKAVPIIAVAHNYKNKSFNQCDAVFCITEDLCRHIATLGFAQEMIFHIPNMVKAESIKNTTCSPKLITRIGSLGRFVEKKGFDIFLNAISLAHKKSRFSVSIGGGGPLKNDLHNLCEKLGITELVKFQGWVEDKEQFFNDIDLFILPSRHEPFGIVLIEAMANGLPCISLPSEGPSEIITDQVNGILVKTQTAEDLAEAITRMLDNPEMALMIGAAGKELVRNKYSDHQIAKTLDAALKEITKPIH